MLPDITKKMTPSLMEAIAEVQKPRSRFQLEHFVVNQHDTDPMRYFQVIMEIQNLYNTIRSVTLEMKKTEIEIARLRATGDEIDEIDAQIKELGLESTRIVGIGAFRELDDLVQIWESFPVKFTRDEIEANQHEYWFKRLTRQSDLEVLTNGSPSQAEHLNSLRQIGVFDLEKARQELEAARKELE